MSKIIGKLTKLTLATMQYFYQQSFQKAIRRILEEAVTNPGTATANLAQSVKNPNVCNNSCQSPTKTTNNP